jgi:hypothetical protein
MFIGSKLVLALEKYRYIETNDLLHRGLINRDQSQVANYIKRTKDYPKNIDGFRSRYWSTAWSAYLARPFIAKKKALVPNLTLDGQHDVSTSSNRTSIVPSVFLGTYKFSSRNQNSPIFWASR